MGRMTSAASPARTASEMTNWRGLPRFVLNEYGVTHDDDGLVRIPYRLPDGSLYAMRVVAPSGGALGGSRETAARLIPFGLDQLADPAFRQYRALAITEGESDALALSATFGVEGLDVLGAPGATTGAPRGHSTPARTRPCTCSETATTLADASTSASPTTCPPRQLSGYPKAKTFVRSCSAILASSPSYSRRPTGIEGVLADARILKAAA